MKQAMKRSVAAIAISLLATQGSWAEEMANSTGDKQGLGQQPGAIPVEASLLAGVFNSPPVAGIYALDEQSMSSTQGDLWPWIIGVATLDLTLASFFWGHYIPITSAAGGLCVNCDIGN
ncbi:MAG: hypothetical protein NWP69_07655, partial [Congregibacter sp.]|nr:hypothetical protein [Congregibacter sp.]